MFIDVQAKMATVAWRDVVSDFPKKSPRSRLDVLGVSLEHRWSVASGKDAHRQRYRWRMERCRQRLSVLHWRVVQISPESRRDVASRCHQYVAGTSLECRWNLDPPPVEGAARSAHVASDVAGNVARRVAHIVGDVARCAAHVTSDVARCAAYVAGDMTAPR